MKFLALFILLAGTIAAETKFITGQGARLVIGQETFTDSLPGASEDLIGASGGIAYAGDNLFIADSNRLGATPNNDRVLVYYNVADKWPKPTEEVPQGRRCNVCVGDADVALGQPDFSGPPVLEEGDPLPVPSANNMRLAIGVSSDGTRLAVADTDYNRVLIWNSLPTTSGQPADLVLGQGSFETSESNGFNPRADSMKGPQGVWLMEDGSLWVADTGNNRILKWNNPSQNGQDADLVLGAPDFTTFVQPDLTQQDALASATKLLTPVSISSDGQRFFIADLGNNRVLIYNSIPTVNQQPADLVVGQADLEARTQNNSQALCDAAVDDDGELILNLLGDPIYPTRCAATMVFPRSVVSDGDMLFIADGGNDRVLVYNEIPTTNGARADAVIGQSNEFVNNTSDSAFPLDIASAGVIRTPTSLAWDGLNLYVSDPFNRRVLVFTKSEQRVANTGVRNAASFEIFAAGRVDISGTPQEEDVEDEEVTIRLRPELDDEELGTDESRPYTYEVQPEDTLDTIAFELARTINQSNDGEGDPEVFATPNIGFSSVILTAKIAGEVGNDITYDASVSTGSLLSLVTASPTLRGGEEATKIAPYTIVSIVGENLSEVTMSADQTQDNLPTELGGVQVYFDGIRSPIYFVSPTQINAQMPVEVFDALGVSGYVRTEHQDGRVVASNAIPVPILPFNPGVFAADGFDPRPALAFHSSSMAMGIVSVDGSATADDTATVTINSREYTYTVTQEDEDAGVCLDQDGEPIEEDDVSCFDKQEAQRKRIMNGLIELINTDPEVSATASDQFTRIRLFSRVEGPEGNGLPYSAESSDSASVIMTATTTELCCANEAGAPLTVDNPAVAGETIVVWATGLGLIQPEEARTEQITGKKYSGPAANSPIDFVSSLVGGRTANVLSCALEVGTFGLYRCDLQLNQGLSNDLRTALTIAQGFQVSNIVTIPVFNPRAPEF
jgi:hypothetical protein